ncbi:MAG: DUF177 domain-containing protein [Rhizobiaceae bacterium]
MKHHHDHEETSPISFRVNVLRLPQKGMPVTISATEEQRKALADVHGLLEVERLEAKLLVAPWKRNGICVSGNVEADVVQACVVTLEPVPDHIDEEIDSLFLPHDSKLGRLGFEGGGEIVLDAEGEDSPEVFEGDSIDVGALAEEFFGLGINPYPRKEGATLKSGKPDDDEARQGSAFGEKLASLLRKE